MFSLLTHGASAAISALKTQLLLPQIAVRVLKLRTNKAGYALVRPCLFILGIQRCAIRSDSLWYNNFQKVLPGHSYYTNEIQIDVLDKVRGLVNPSHYGRVV